MGETSTALGRWGEEQVALYLQAQGYYFVTAGWRCRFGEIDIIVQNGTFLVFVEVKLRKNDRFAQAREFVSPSKQQKLRTTASLYLAEHPTELQPRFDVAEIYAPQGVSTLNPKIQYFENAF